MHDILIKNGTIIDGTGGPGFRGDIAIGEGRITAVGDAGEAASREIIDAAGKIVAPGFIDLHSHADFVMPLADHDRVLKPLVMQGVTTFIGGNCGFSAAYVPAKNRGLVSAHLENLSGRPMDDIITWRTPAEYFDTVRAKGMLLNMGMLAGHGTLRIASSGLETRLLFPDEMKEMERLLEESLEMGCLGLSTGLQYFPGSMSDTDELVRMGSVLKKYGGIFTSHLRSYSHTLDLAMEEVFEVGRQNGVRLQISHLYWQPYSRGMATVTRQAVRLGSFAYNRLKLPIPVEKGLVPKIRTIEKRRREGIDVHFDMVPTSQGFTELFAFLPPYVSEGSRAQALERLADRAFRKRVLHDIDHVEPDWPHRDGATWSFNYLKMTGWDGLRVMAVPTEGNRWMEGKTFPEIARETGREAFDAICDLLIEENGQVLVFHTPTVPDDPFVFRSMWAGFTHPLSMPATDAILRPVGRPAHVFYDCFPRFIQAFALDRKMLSMEEVIRKITSLPADIMGLEGRGRLSKGCHADVVVFDPVRLRSGADFYNPEVHPEGIEHVIVNGRAVVRSGVRVEGVLAGDVVRRGA